MASGEMNGDPTDDAGSARRRRLAAQLRENLRRRKSQARARADETVAREAAPEPKRDD